MPPRYQPNPYRVTLDLDPATSDALTQAAKASASTRHRLAYDFVQRGLGIGVTIATKPPSAGNEPDELTRVMQRGLDDLDRLKPARG